MAKDRFVKCEFYLNEGNCAKKREGSFYHYCQHCDQYRPVRGSIPAKKNLKREKIEKARKEDFR